MREILHPQAYKIFDAELKDHCCIPTKLFEFRMLEQFGFPATKTRKLLKAFAGGKRLVFHNGKIHLPLCTSLKRVCPRCGEHGYGAYSRANRVNGNYYRAEYFEHYSQGKIGWCYLRSLGRVDPQLIRKSRKNIIEHWGELEPEVVETKKGLNEDSN